MHRSAPFDVTYDDTPWTRWRLGIFMLLVAAWHLAIFRMMPDSEFLFSARMAPGEDLYAGDPLEWVALSSLVLLLPIYGATELWDEEPVARVSGMLLAAPGIVLVLVTGEAAWIASLLSVTGSLALYAIAFDEGMRHPSRHMASAAVSGCVAWALIPGLYGSYFGGLVAAVTLSLIVIVGCQCIIEAKLRLFYR